jgi:ankyrin repeat protein
MNNLPSFLRHNKITHVLCLSLLLLGATALGMNNLNEQLIDAAASGNCKEVKILIAQGASINAKGDFGWTPLIIAAINSREAMCRLLIELHAAVETKDDSGGTPLIRAAESGHETECALLIANKASVNAKDNDERTPLICAASNGYEGLSKLLIANKASVNAKDNDERTPLICAALNGYEGQCKLLIANKASINAKDKDKRTPFIHAALSGYEGLYELLIDAQLEPIRKSKAAIVTLLGIAKRRLAKLSCRIPYDVAKIIARKAFAMIQQDKQPVIEQINEIYNKEKRANWLAYAKQQMNSPIVITQDADGDQAHNGIPAQDIKSEKPQLVEKCTLQ